jgi:hypothetical protein
MSCTTSAIIKVYCSRWISNWIQTKRKHNGTRSVIFATAVFQKIDSACLVDGYRRVRGTSCSHPELRDTKLPVPNYTASYTRRFTQTERSTLIVPDIYVSIQGIECIEIELSADYCRWKGRAVWGPVIEGEPDHNGQISGPPARRMGAARHCCVRQSPFGTSDFPWHSCVDQVLQNAAIINWTEMLSLSLSVAYRRTLICTSELIKRSQWKCMRQWR